jgi:hypothetical protein
MEQQSQSHREKCDRDLLTREDTKNYNNLQEVVETTCLASIARQSEQKSIKPGQNL